MLEFGESHVVSHAQHAQTGRVTRAEIAVDVVVGQSRVFQSAFG